MPEMEIKKTLLIIKSDPKSLGTAEAFLRNREWFVYSTNNLKEAMMFLVQKKPSFVMVAVDHPNKKVRALPKLIVQALPCCVIAYAETSSAKAFRFLQESGVEYRVNPPVTGPAIERTVNKYIKDQQAAEEKAKSHSVDSALREKKSGGLERGPVVMKGHDSPGASMPGTFVMKGEGPRGGALDAASLFRQMGIEMPDNGEGGGMPPGESARYGSIRTSAADVRSSEPGVIYGNDAEEETLSLWRDRTEAGRFNFEIPGFEGRDPESLSAEEKRQYEAIGNAILSGQDFQGIAFPFEVPGFEGRKPDELSAEELAEYRHRGGMILAKGRKARSRAILQQGASTGGFNFVATEDESAGDFAFSEGDSEAGSIIQQKRKKTGGQGAWVPGGEAQGPRNAPISYGKAAGKIGPKGRKPSEFSDINQESSTPDFDGIGSNGAVRVGKFGKSTGTTKVDSIIVKGTQQALEESVDLRDGVVIDKLQNSSNVACIVVESPRFSGYLVAAMGKNRRIDDKFINVIRERLFKFLKENGEDMHDEENLQIQIKQVDFEGWALEYADFLRKSVHNGDEIAMAFFPFSEAKSTLSESASADMGAVKIDDLKGDFQVDFNLYIYLPANKKYVLYTPKGGKFYSNQKERLTKMGITHMHMRRDELQDLSRYRAQNYLNAKIEEYLAKKNKSRAS